MASESSASPVGADPVDTGARADAEHAGGVAIAAGLLRGLTVALAEQAVFHRSELVDFAGKDLHSGLRMAEARALSARLSGPRQLQEIRKTVLSELLRGTILSVRVLREAGVEAWPDLSAAVTRSWSAILAVLETEPGLLWPSALPSDGPGHAAAGEGGAGLDWRSTDGDGHVRMAENGCVLSVLPMGFGDGADREWVARVGSVGIGLFVDAGQAKAAAEDVMGILDRFQPKRRSHR